MPIMSRPQPITSLFEDTDKIYRSGQPDMIRPEPLPEKPANTFGFSEGLIEQFQERGLETSSDLYEMFNEMSPADGNSAEFQRLMYAVMTGQQPPEHYTGFHAGQIGRLDNVIDPEAHNIAAMEEVALLATLFREMQGSGGFQEIPGVATGYGQHTIRR